MIHVSGAFVYQPSSSPRPGISYPATFLIKLIINSDDGTPVFNSNDELLERLRAFSCWVIRRSPSTTGPSR
jgi:hypothetical protein